MYFSKSARTYCIFFEITCANRYDLVCSDSLLWIQDIMINSECNRIKCIFQLVCSDVLYFLKCAKRFHLVCSASLYVHAFKVVSMSTGVWVFFIFIPHLGCQAVCIFLRSIKTQSSFILLTGYVDLRFDCCYAANYYICLQYFLCVTM